MSPSLEVSMFNRSANLSARRLLEEPGFPRIVPQRCVRPHDSPPPRPPYGCHHDWKPSNVELERLQAREKVGYFNSKAAPHGLDRREAELVFRFDSQASAEYLDYHPPAVQYTKPANGFSSPRVDRHGPFVFGVHSPSHFPSPPSLEPRNDVAAARSEPTDERTVINDVADKTNHCDKVNEWSVPKSKSRRTLNRMFQIKDKRKVKGNKKAKIKCVLVGDGAVGKSSLIAAYAQDTFRDEYEPTAYDTFNVVVDVDSRPIRFEICDTAGQDSMSELRALCYPGTDVLMLCFSVVRPDTFRSVTTRWSRAAAAVGAPLVLVGTQGDLARDLRVLNNLRLRGEHVVSDAEARAFASKINAVYIETSAKTRSKLKEAFDAAILAALPVISKKRPFWKKLLCIN